MIDVICDCCYVMRGWIRQCNCVGGPTRLHSDNIFGIAEPWLDSRMGRNERPDAPVETTAASQQQEG